MCTALTLKTPDGQHLFGRTLDLEYNFGQSVVFVPRGFKYNDNGLSMQIKHAIIGMGTVYKGYPMLADAMNEHGLACAGLNFPKFGSYSKEESATKNNIEVFRFPMWLLSNYTNIKEARKILENTLLIDKEAFEGLINPVMHWIITDKTGETIVVEPTIDGLTIHNNPYGVLTNAPNFDWHTTNLARYIHLSYNQIANFESGTLNLSAMSQGTGMLGLPGDFTSASRFVRATFLRDATISNVSEFGLPQFFRILDGVSVPKGAMMTAAQKIDYTQYVSCMNLNTGDYYYKTYDGYGVHLIRLQNENLDSTELKSYPCATQFIITEGN